MCLEAWGELLIGHVIISLVSFNPQRRYRGDQGSERLLDLFRLTQQWGSDSTQVCRKMGGGSRRITWKFPGPTTGENSTATENLTLPQNKMMARMDSLCYELQECIHTCAHIHTLTQKPRDNCYPHLQMNKLKSRSQL